MKRTFAAMLVALVASGAVLSIAAVPPPAPSVQPLPPPPPPRGGRGAAGRGAPPANLGGAMNDMNRMLTAVKAESTDPSKLEQTLKDIALMQRDAAISKTILPPGVNKLAGEKKVQETEAYRVMMVGLMKNLMDLEEAVVSKKPDEVRKLLTQLEEIENKGHGQFIPMEG